MVIQFQMKMKRFLKRNILELEASVLSGNLNPGVFSFNLLIFGSIFLYAYIRVIINCGFNNKWDY